MNFRKNDLLLLGLVFAGYAGLVVLMDSSLCMVRLITGLPCPGCGLTHAGLAVLRGDMAAAARDHIGIFLLPLTAGVLIFRRFSPKKKSADALLFGIALFFLIYFLIRLWLYFPDGPYPMIWDEHSLYGYAKGRLL